MAEAAKSGAASAIDEAMDEADELVLAPVLPLFGPEGAKAHRAGKAVAARKAGRPPGAKNKRTEAIREWFVAKFGHPMEKIGQLVNTPTLELAGELRCEPEKALQIQKDCLFRMLEYIEQKQPASVEVGVEGDLVLKIGRVGEADAEVARVKPLVLENEDNQ